MGYTHYYYVTPQFDKKLFAKVVADFNKMLDPIKQKGVILAGESGDGDPIVNTTKIAFNGLTECGHPKIMLMEITPENYNDCMGRCAHERFLLEQTKTTVIKRRDGSTYGLERQTGDPSIYGKYFTCTKTARKPYDLAVVICLIIAKHHLKGSIRVETDGGKSDWEPAIQMCEEHLGYGMKYSSVQCWWSDAITVRT